MNNITCLPIPADDANQLNEIMGYHFRVIQPPTIQVSLVNTSDHNVIETLLRRGAPSSILSGAIQTLKRCVAEGQIFVVRRDNRIIGYTAYSPILASSLQISHRANEPVALINMFRVPNPKQGIYDSQAGEFLIHTLLDNLRDTTHFRLAYRIGNDNPNELSLERMMPPTALGFNDYRIGNNQWRVAGLNAADMSMGIYRRPANLKGPSFMAPNWSR